MANLFSLFHELRERIAASSSSSSSSSLTPPNNKSSSDDPALILRFRQVIPILLQTYVIPNSSANEKEVIATLKLLNHTVKIYPGIFYNGKASAILPTICRILPFFAEPSFSSRQGIIFETLGSLLSLLRSGDRDAYRLFFKDVMGVFEDLLTIATIANNTCKSELEVSLRCFHESLSVISTDSTALSELPACIKPIDGFGIIINLTGVARWQPFATWMIKVSCKCLTEGALYVEGLINVPFVLAACKLLCYGDAALQMACFDLVRILGEVVSDDIIPSIIPSENMILSISAILSEEEEGRPVFRDSTYDSFLGGCLQALYSSCTDDVIKLTATDIVNVFPKSMQKTKSPELKTALCGAYVRIAKVCPPHIWKPESLFNTLRSPKPYHGLVECFQVVLSMLDLDFVGEATNGEESLDASLIRTSDYESVRVGEKRSIQLSNVLNVKRQKLDLSNGSMSNLQSEGRNEYTEHAGSTLMSLIESLKAPGGNANLLEPEISLTALSILCIALCKCPRDKFIRQVSRQMLEWIPWISEQVNQESLGGVDLPIYLEALHRLLLRQRFLSQKDNLFRENDNAAYLMQLVLKTPWNHALMTTEPCLSWKTKCFCLQILPIMGTLSQSGGDLGILDLGLQDEADEVRNEATIAMPLIVLCEFGTLAQIFKRLEFLWKEKTEKVKKSITIFLGYLACLYGSSDGTANLFKNKCMLFLQEEKHIHSWTGDQLLQGFWCSLCDKSIRHSHESLSITPNLHNMLDCDYTSLVSLFFTLLYDESEEVQLSCVSAVGRVLVHMDLNTLHETKTEWIKSIDYLLLHRRKSVREAFSRQIRCFVQNHILTSFFLDEQLFLDRVRNGYAVANDPEVYETLLEATAGIMVAADINGRLFLASLIMLLDQLDNPYVTVRMSASKLIHRSCFFHHKGGLEKILAKFHHIRNEVYDFLSLRLGKSPKMVAEFAAGFLDVKSEELVERMVPVVVPKLVITQQDNDQAKVTLFVLAKCLNKDMVQLATECLPKVLALALYQADGQKLDCALQFYCGPSGMTRKEVVEAAVPELLYELVCSEDVDDSVDTSIRLSRVPQMIKEVAKILTENDDLPGFLRHHFVGLLDRINRKMLYADDTLLQVQATKCIEILINMMGSHLGTYVPKLMVLLMHAIDKEPLQRDGLAALHFFIRQLAKVSPSSTKHVISQVFAAIIPLLEKQKGHSILHMMQIVKILEELVFENKSVLKQHIYEFPPLPNIPALAEVNKVIDDARGTMTLKDQLRDIVVGLNHENLNVRYMVACELSKLLKLKRDDVAVMVDGEEDSDMDVLSSLITSLLRGCAEESRTIVGQRLKLVCADCLGSLGAIDPAKVKGFSNQRFKIACSDDDLIFELIHKHLARAFRAAPDTSVQDMAALAIQELLKIAGCNASLEEDVSASHISKLNVSNKMDGRGQRLWDRFSNYIKEIIAPCLTSRFHLPNMADSASSGPIYQPSLSFRRWIFNWVKKLTAHATGSRASIFNACRGIVRRDMQTATYLLPYLVLHVVLHGTEDARRGITQEILSVLDAAASESVPGISSGQSEVCIQAVFTLLDNLGQWVDDVKQELTLSQSNSKQKLKHNSLNYILDSDQLSMQCEHVSELLSAIPKVTLAKASFRCQAYARSLLYFECHVREKSGSFNPSAEKSGIFEDEDVSFLMEIYSGLDETDGLSGLASLRKSKSLQDQLLINKKAGNWAEVLTSCEQALQMEPTSVQRHSDVLNCLINMCHLQAVVTHVDGLISRIPQYKKTWCMQGIQAAWRLGRWDLTDEYLDGADEEGLLCSSSESNASFDMDVAKILRAMRMKDQFSVSEKIALSKQALIAPLAAAGMDSYTRAYPYVVKLHVLQELEDFHSILNGESFLEKSCAGQPEFLKVTENWDNRLRFTQPSLWTREPLLAFRRLVFGASGLTGQVGNCWVQYAKLCRSSGHYETANRAILEAMASGAANVHMEKAKLLWSTRRSDGAIAELQQSLMNFPVEVIGSATMSSITSLSLVPINQPALPCNTQASNENRDVAKTLLLYSRWIHYTGLKQKEDVMSLFSRVRLLQPKWEKGYFYAAKYCDEVLVDARKRQEENSGASTEKAWWCFLPDVLLFYAKGLHRGHKNLFQALPRLLTLWFEFGSIYQRKGSSSKKDMKTVHDKLMSIMRGCYKDLPTYQWLTVLPQLVSRICHQNDEIVRVVKQIITSVLGQYTQQGLWIMAAVSKSTVSSRRDAAAEIINNARKRSNQGAPNALFGQFASLIDHLIRLCFHASQSKSPTINISTEFSSLKRMMPTEIIMPTQGSISVSLPTIDTSTTAFFSATDYPTITGIADEAEVLSSLQKPKKIILLGSDGVKRPFLCKPKDDLRKDARMMEFNTMINRLLSKSPESRRRKLYVRTFSVIPLTEDCGMVEWVPHTRGLRHILQDIYISSGKFDRQKTNPLIKRIYDQCHGKMAEDDMLKNKILPMFPPAFHKWFLNTFSEPAAWFRARVAYAHTTAVWSMVGHIVGLGDRHGENILFDSTTGDCVHVDFSCLFDRGLQLEKPELVPFRLTQNMIDGLGITGYEGTFLKVCEITLSVLREHRETLMSVLETFIHDPLVEWTKTHKSSGVEVQNPHAQRAISNIEARLQGIVVGVGAAPSLPLAVEGQARRLIAEAVSHKNLGKMYIWWMPWF
uniref:serine/threonine-protein kinase ATR n=1 Tax=Erigeron canadensis TaxID=72917 RepID=UPI001CB94011|nr:serine/threonine-protein kinase ATR [Erigeron canadensis]